MNDNQDGDQNRYTYVHYGIMRQLKITANEYLILDTVFFLSMERGYCYKSVASMGVDIGVTRMGSLKIVNRLLERGLLAHSAAGGLVASAEFVRAVLDEKVNKVDSKQSLQAHQKRVNKVSKNVNKVARCKQSTNKKKNIEKEKKVGTNVPTAKPAVYGKPEINDLFDYWQRVVGYPITGKRELNRRAASNLHKKYGTEKMHRLIDGVAMAHEDRYAPSIADFAELQSNLNRFLAWGHKQHKQADISAIEVIS